MKTEPVFGERGSAAVSQWVGNSNASRKVRLFWIVGIDSTGANLLSLCEGSEVNDGEATRMDQKLVIYLPC